MLALASSPSVVTRPAAAFKRECLWCGGAFHASARHGEFCCTEHRKAFNNQRATRGAELYDLAMAVRYDRKRATALGVLQMMWTLCRLFREEDQRLRAGRPSWRDPGVIVERRPYIAGDYMLRRARPQ